MADEKKQSIGGSMQKVAEKIENASNILVAVSKDPTVDELSAALGLTMMLDGMGKHATAIYSGQTPNAIQFLEPEKTFESNTNSLQDFIIALSKDKADHLRYKIDGDFVKVFITPYKTTIDESDLEFSHGDFNVDLVIALGVPSTDDLDAALSEHGRILHDASSINITNSAPGEFGEMQWSEPGASSVSEMVSGLAFMMKDKVKMNKVVATAFLTGIVANTDRFLNDRTTPTTMDVAAKLMQAGANQQLISSNLEEALEKTEGQSADGALEVKNKGETGSASELDKLAEMASGSVAPSSTTSGDVASAPVSVLAPTPVPAPESPAPESAVSMNSAEQQLNQMIAQPAAATSPIMNELQQAAEGGDATGTFTGGMNELTPSVESSTDAATAGGDVAHAQVQNADIYPKAEEGITESDRGKGIDEPELTIPKDYGQMMEEALAEPLPNPAATAAPVAPTGPELNHIPEMEYIPHAQTTPVTIPTMGNEYLTADAQAPQGQVAMPAQAPVPEVNANAPVPGVQLPPAPVPPVPNIQMPPMPDTQAPVASAPQEMVQAVPPVEAQGMTPTLQEQTVAQLEQANDPGAFKIPGM